MTSDLLYLDDVGNVQQIREQLSQRFPNVKQIKDYDSIHGFRLAINGEVDTREYFKFLLEYDIAFLSLRLQMCANMECEDTKILRSILDETQQKVRQEDGS